MNSELELKNNQEVGQLVDFSKPEPSKDSDIYLDPEYTVNINPHYFSEIYIILGRNAAYLLH